MRALSSLRLILISLLVGEGLLAILLGPGKVASAAANESAARRPVLGELFTSGWCWGWPRVHALLARLDQTQFVPGAQVIVLSEHVTYWNQDGWHDPFSLDTMTARQQEYTERFGIPSSYTPQAVVDGATQVVGSDGRKLAAAVEQAAAA